MTDETNFLFSEAIVPADQMIAAVSREQSSQDFVKRSDPELQAFLSHGSIAGGIESVSDI